MSKTINLNRAVQFLTGIGIVILSSCSSKQKNETATNTDSAIMVTVALPSSAGAQSMNVSGQVEASQSATISTRVMGYITKLDVKIGDHVSKGQLLGTISNDDIKAKRAQADAQIAQAETAFKNAQKDYDRFTVLYKQQSASAKEMDNIAMQYSAAKAGLESAKQMRIEANAMLSYTRLTAPFEGIITQKNLDAGSMANPGMPILTIERKGSYQVSASVPESAIGQVKQGGTALISISAVNKTIKGTIAQVNQSSEFTGGQYTIKITIPDDEKAGLYAGMYANVVIPVKATANTAETNGQVMVPLASIEHKDELTGLYTIGSNNTAMLRWVRLGKVYGDKVEVLSGLAAGEQFIASADGKLFNGEPVKIK